jgi:hypothetical protein
MAKNDEAGIQTAKDMVLKMAHISLMKSRGLPQDHIAVVEMAEDIVKLATKFRDLMVDDADQYRHLPQNVVPFRPTAH